MADAAFFLRKKPRPGEAGGPAARPGAPHPAGAGPAGAGPAGGSRPPGAPPLRRPPPRPMGRPGPSRPGLPTPRPGVAIRPRVPARAGTPLAGAVKAEPAAAIDPDKIVEIPIYSPEPGAELRYNIMRLNYSTSEKDKYKADQVDLSKLPQPLLMNRKQPGPKQPPLFQFDANGNIVGRYVYDEAGKPVLDDEGKPIVEKKNEMDMSLVGMAPGASAKRRGKRNTKEVFHQDVEVIKLRREEANPWVLEPKNPSEKPSIPEHWVGRMSEPSSLPTILLVNSGEGASFTMVPLGRTYRFDSARPFKVMDSDQANKYFEMQAKYKIHDRWGQRQEDIGPGLVKTETSDNFENRARNMEMRIKSNKGEELFARTKRETFEEDYRREGRNIGRGLEGGFDEELDFDVNEEFQDDEDSNTFYINKDEEDEKKIQEERQKQEFRWANANVGDRPQIEGEDGSDGDGDLFGDKLTSEGKRLRRMMRKRLEDEGELLDSSDEDDSDTDDEERQREKEKEREKERQEKESERQKERERANRTASRAGSRAPDGRGRTGSPGRLHPSADRTGSAPPGAGAALLAKRAASRGVSPRPRASSPLARGSSPDARGGSPAPGARAGSPMAREGSPAVAGAAAAKPKSKSAKRKASSESPLRDVAPPTASPAPSSLGTKRKTTEDTPPVSAGASPADGAAAKKKKKSRASTGSATPQPGTPTATTLSIPTTEEVLAWLRSQPDPDNILQQAAANNFLDRLRGPDMSQRLKLFLSYIRSYTSQPSSGILALRPEYRS